MRIGIVYTRARPEEKLLVQAANDLGIEIVQIHDEHISLDNALLNPVFHDLNAVLIRTLSLNRAIVIAQYLQRWDIPCFNTSQVLELTGDKWATSLMLSKSGIPTPNTSVSFTQRGAVESVERIGFPIVSKPLSGSWARMVSKCNDIEALEAVMEHKAFMNGKAKINYLQEFVEKPGRDLRIFILGEQAICGITRNSEHWITNTARGATTANLELTEEMHRICSEIGRAIPNSILAIDLMESEDGLVVHEINGTMEFRNSIETTGVNIPARILQFIQSMVE